MANIVYRVLDTFLDEEEIKRIATKAVAKMPLNNPNFPPSPYYRFLEELVGVIQPELSVELGVSGGGGSLHLCRGWLTGRVVGVDITLDHEDNINYIKRFYDNFTFMQMDSIQAAHQIYQNYGKIDLLFIDTVHTYERTIAEFKAYDPYLAEDAIVCLDDLKREGMEQAWQELPGRKLRLDYLHPGSTEGGFGVIY